ncbi:MAG: HD-GYP domain-containing protein [Oligoflexia bacterium]|nr:HD-GYP domain-containing protein [Oligoflexia bacterium]
MRDPKKLLSLDDLPEWAVNVSEALLRALQERDPYTYGHCRRVARIARNLGQAAGLTSYEQQVVEYSSLFHDLGKLGIPDQILLKPGRLNAEEEEIMRLHPIKSAEIIAPLAHVSFFRSTIPGIRYHHERIDGLGYPDRIKGENIPLTARIILIADTYDAMTTTRPYRKGMTSDIAYKELRLFSGRQFDPHLVEIFVKAHPKWGEVEKEISAEIAALEDTRKIA